MAAAPKPTISLSDVAVAYQGRVAIEGLTGMIAAGSLTAVIGPNGAGKSTLFKAILGLVPLSRGQIALSGITKREIAYLPQRSDIDRTFPISVADVAGFGLWRRIGPFGRIGSELHDAVDAALTRVGLAGFGRRPLDRLSGGELQRVLLARLIVQNASAMLLDEPFAALDAATTGTLLSLIEQWHGEGRSLLVALHDLNLVRRHFPQTLILARRPIAWGPTANVLDGPALDGLAGLAAGRSPEQTGFGAAA